MDQQNREIAMFGMTIEQVRKEPLFKTPDIFGDVNYAMCILSDVQEMMERGEQEKARQCINKAKYWLSRASTKARGLPDSEE